MLPHLTQVEFADQVSENNYFLISGMGSPRILTDELTLSVDDINEIGHYDYLVLVIDADEMCYQEKVDEINDFIQSESILLNPECQLKIIVQKYCMESWFLGNRKVYPRNTDNLDFLKYAQRYDVSQQNPELMQKPDSFIGSTSIYHETYLRKMLATKNIRYSKSKPKEIGEKYYLEELQNRVNDTNDLPSLKSFFNFCTSLG